MPLNPATYECPVHHIDLTPQVKEALEELPPPNAFGQRRFRVVVSCPGDGTSGAHEQACTGER